MLLYILAWFVQLEIFRCVIQFSSTLTEVGKYFDSLNYSCLILIKQFSLNSVTHNWLDEFDNIIALPLFLSLFLSLFADWILQL